MGKSRIVCCKPNPEVLICMLGLVPVLVFISRSDTTASFHIGFLHFPIAAILSGKKAPMFSLTLMMAPFSLRSDCYHDRWGSNDIDAANGSSQRAVSFMI